MSRSVTAYPLDDAHRRALLTIAADSIGHALFRGDGEPEVPEPSGDLALDQAAATFVTLERGDALLGCIGTLEATEPLAASVARNACKAAFADPRLPAVTVRRLRGDGDQGLGAVPPHADARPIVARRRAQPPRRHRRPARRSRRSPGHAAAVGVAEGRRRGAVPRPAVAQGRPPARATGCPRTRVSKYTTEEFTDPGPRRLPSLPLCEVRGDRIRGGQVNKEGSPAWIS